MAVKDRNRYKNKQPHGRSSWCFGSDANHVHDGTKCTVCGFFQGPKRFKAGKFVPMIRDFEEE